MHFKLKQEELGVFNPLYKDLKDLGMVQGAKYPVFTDPYY